MFGALLTNVSKAFDCLPQDVIIAKLNAYEFNMKALNFIYDYLRNRKQRTTCTDQHVQVKIGAAQIENSSSEKLLSVTIDVKLSFEKHIEQIYAKARAKLKA